MGHAIAEPGLIDAYRGYSGLISALGHEVNEDAIARHLAEGEDEGEVIARILRGGHYQGGDEASLSPSLAAKMDDLRQGLTAQIGTVACAWLGADPGRMEPEHLATVLRAQPEERRDAISGVLMLDGHRRFLRPRRTTASQLREILGEDSGRLDWERMLPCVVEELAKRGVEMEEREIRVLLEEAPGDAEAPYCLKSILRDVAGRFRTGLIPLEELVGEEDADEWLERVRCRLQFRSHSAMHKALAEATSLKYDCVHKALSGKQKAKRVQAEIKNCLARWLRDVDEGREPDIADEHRGVPVEETQALMPALEKRFATKEEIYRILSRKTGVKTGSVRRYFQNNGQLKYAPLVVWRWAEKLTQSDAPVQVVASYLDDAKTRAAAFELARRAREMLVRWRKSGDDPDLEMAYRELRRALIVVIKERRHRAPATA